MEEGLLHGIRVLPPPRQAGKQSIGVDVDRGTGTGALRRTLRELWLSGDKLTNSAVFFSLVEDRIDSVHLTNSNFWSEHDSEWRL